MTEHRAKKDRDEIEDAVIKNHANKRDVLHISNTKLSDVQSKILRNFIDERNGFFRSIKYGVNNFQDRRSLDEALKRALGACLEDHPAIRGWVSTCRLFAQRDILRAPRRGLEKGIKATKAEDAWLMIEAGPLLERGDSLVKVQGILLKRIQRRDYVLPPLVGLGSVPTLEKRLRRSVQNFFHWVKQAGLTVGRL